MNDTVQPTSGRWLFRYAVLTAVCTLVLLCLGGLVTSKDVGMAVPDWPTSYGYNMFFFPFEKWTGGIFDEHLHRLVASGVGALTLGLAVWLQFQAPNPTLKRLGWLALGLVTLQGVLGGLRVVLDQQVVADTTLGTVFGLLHACLGQGFFVLLGAIALLLAPLWLRLGRAAQSIRPGACDWLLPATTAIIFLQLVLGALMRHQHAGLAIHDFPLAYGSVWPGTDAAALTRYNQSRTEELPVTAFVILVQMFHRLGAVVIVILVAACLLAVRQNAPGSFLVRGTNWWLGLIATQFFLGATTIWTDKAADVATAHMAVGALSLATGALLTLAARRLRRPAGAGLTNERASVAVSANPSVRGIKLS